ncbi:MAG: type VI secretion system tip protein VgrG [Pararhodobacter sp.]|nr:type VI secretion system tip protein VgrG [Pararhodobacter sp.]
MPVDQSKRLLSLKSPLGPDKLVPIAFSGHEAISELFEFTIDMVAEDDAIDPGKLLGQSLTLNIKKPDDSKRHISGMVRHFSRGMPYGIGLRHYRAIIVPQFWLTTLRRDFRIFQEKSVQDIIKELLGEARISPRLRAVGGTTVRTYCTQYDETTFNFLSRLMEEEGLYYFFKHGANGHEMIIGDATAHYETSEDTEVSLHTTGDRHSAALSDWRSTHDVITGKITQTDYDFESPGKNLQKHSTTLAQPAIHKDQEFYHYPGRYIEPGVGTDLTKTRMEALEATHERLHGAGTAAGLFAGAKTKLSGHPYGSERNRGFLCVRVMHEATDEGGLSQEGSGLHYENRFEAIPDTVLFRPPRRADRELVRGPLTALVVGPNGEEIYCDKHGRIKVQFHWDRKGSKNQNSSCWIRVAQMLSGKGWGSQFIPRIGMEVVVQFINGDPDRPLVVGSVYNGDNPPPYSLPDNKTQSGLKSRSTPKGSGETFNELRFEDKKDAEEIYFHAEKDFQRVVENDDSEDVGNDQSITVKNNREKTITEGNENITIKKGNRDTKLETGNDSLSLSKGNRNVTLDQGNHDTKISQGNASVTLNQGNYTLKASAGNVKIEAAQSIELKVGSSSIKLTPAGIDIKAVKIGIKADARVEVKGAMAEVNASGILILKGGITKIN